MKRICVILTLVCLSLSANAQNDLSVSFKNIVAGNNYSGFVDLTIDITNNGPSTIFDTDTLLIGLNIDDVPHSLNKIQGGFTRITFSGSIAPGSTVALPLVGFSDTIPSGSGYDLCVVIYGTDFNAIDTNSSANSPFPLTTTWDSNFSDNAACIVYTPTITSIEELTEMTAKLFFSNGQIVYDWTNLSEADEAVVRMISINGQVLLNETVSLNEGRNYLNVNELSSGLYIVSIQVNGEVSSIKVYVE